MKLLYFVAEDWFFCSHFMARAKAARDAGHDVVVLAHDTGSSGAIRAEGLRFIGLDLSRGSINPLREAGTVLQVFRAYRNEMPDLLHHVALKPVIYGSLAARVLGLRRIINAPVGMGYVFSSSSLKARLLRPFVRALLRAFLQPPGAAVVYENSDDLSAHVKAGSLDARSAVLIRGAGVDTDHFQPLGEPPGVPVVTLAARMLRDKGVVEFVEAAKSLRNSGVAARFRLAGAPDPGNPASLDETQLVQWQAEGNIEWLGHCADMASVWQDTHIACLPSYREGLPKALLEALACGLPVVTTDVPGCREVVNDNQNGFLVPAKDAAALATALGRLIGDKELRLAFGARGRARALAEFSDQIVIGETLKLYQTRP